MKKLLASIGLWLALTTGALAACPVGWTGLGSCDTLLDKLTNADVNAALGATITLGSGKTVTISNTVTFTATDTASVAFGAGGTVTYNAATQTLTNKTLTSPTINGGALSGTLSGTPTLSGNLTFSGVPLMTGLSGGTVVSYVGLDSGNDLVLGTPAGSGNALFGTTTGNVANDIVTMANTTVGVKDGGITYGLTGDSVLLETTSGGLVTASTLPLATSSVRGAVIPDGTIITVSGGDITVAKSSSSGFGVAEVDNSTITASGGVISAVNVGTVTHGTITSGDFCLGGTSPQISCSTAPGTGVITALGQNVTGSGGIVLVTSPTLVTPVLGVATGTSLALGGATIGSNQLAINGILSLSGTPSTITLNPNNTANYGTFEMVSSVDPSTLSAGARWFSIQSTVTPNSNSSNTYQSASIITTLGGAAQQQAELGGLFNNIVINSGAEVWASSNVHTDESRFDITGTVGGTAANFLSLENTYSGASVVNSVGFECTPNYAAGTVTTSVCLQNDAQAGSNATNTYLVKNSNAAAGINTLGTVTIGNLTAQSSNLLLIDGPDTSASTFPIKVNNSTPAIIFDLSDAGVGAFPQGTLTLGQNNSVAGKLQIEMASGNSGSVNLVAANGSTAATVTIPDTTGTLASLSGTNAFLTAQAMNLGLSVTGGAVNLDVSSNFAVNMRTGSTTSTVTIGNSANAIALAAPVTMSNELTTETSATANAPINIPPGSAPTSPANGDLWTTSVGVFARVAGSTVGPFGSSGTGCTSSGSDILLGNGSGGCTNYAGTSASGEILLSLNAAGVGTFSATPTLGASGTLGSVTMGNATSGTLTLEPATGAITGTVLIPSGSDTLVNLTGTQTLTGKSIAGSEINSGTVGPTYGGTGENNGSYTITLGGNVSTAGAFSTAGAYGLTLTASNTTNATLPAGSTNIPDYAAITSGDICQGGTAPAFSCNVATTGSGSVVLATSPSIASPTITSSLTATGLVTLGDIATQATNTVLVNATSGSASPTAQSVSTCSAAADALNWTTNTGFGCNTSITASAAPLSGITGFGTGVASALADNVGSAGAPVVFNGALGTPSSGSAANLTAATSSTLGPVKPDGATISNSSGAISLNLANENKWTASQQVTIQTLTISTTTYTPNFDTGNDFEINTINHTTCAAGACTFANPSTTPVAGQHGVIYVVQDSTGGGSIGSTKWGTDYLFAGGTAPTFSTGANAIDAISYAVLSSTQIICTVAALNVSNP